MHIYHLVPRNLEGSVLYPLNQLQHVHPRLYQLYRRNYQGRSNLFEERIPPLDCLWHDALFFTPVHPKLIEKALREAGYQIPHWFRFFEIDARRLDPAKTALFTEPDRYHDFDPKTLFEFSRVPEETVEYYRDTFKKRHGLFMFYQLPHVLYKNSIDVFYDAIVGTDPVPHSFMKLHTEYATFKVGLTGEGVMHIELFQVLAGNTILRPGFSYSVRVYPLFSEGRNLILYLEDETRPIDLGVITKIERFAT